MSNEIQVKFSAHLKRFVDLPEEFIAKGETVSDIVDALEQEFPGVSDYLIHENGKLRQHVNLFLDNKLIFDRNELSDPIEGTKTLFIMQALSGG